ncbi:hypothetical protein FZI85_17295 [Mycobacterium sp. CBMA293]|uniref:hypothetical protein n=1 Tax=unclassified Mycolicibacterium TaxID=2636767 RepID=UPI0012DD57ED|nr:MULTISPECIES: hypothetical protein [unclassified Mycolicibacterium]MUL44478.1 hypothetical protein [Mycolicibacterium sp. CBMA 360]MUL59798.1 hypothetical protein [Mycolicibacterium sp. CBMA 335]MUL68641.1 hypothetical protein [Mycolicibacterium sp. CBMA 311]MUL93968.1 hypothetical protein [Mycolicibacterium sp. CBMA 230]MUM06214.1 hypothetical protein [Mycolicibacterium sp. CBMA 213]
MSEATLTFDDDIEQLIREIARDEIKKFFADKAKAVLASALSNVVKGQAKPAPGITKTQLAEAIQAAIAKRQAQQGNTEGKA